MIYRFSEKLAKTFVLQSMPCLYGCMKLKYQGHRHPLKIFKLKRTEASKLYKYFSISIPHQWLPLWNLLCAKISSVFLLSMYIEGITIWLNTLTQYTVCQFSSSHLWNIFEQRYYFQLILNATQHAIKMSVLRLMFVNACGIRRMPQ